MRSLRSWKKCISCSGEQARKEGQAAEGGVGCQSELDDDGEGHDEVEHAVADARDHDLVEHCVVDARAALKAVDDDGESEKHECEDDPEEGLRALGVHNARLAESRHVVRNRFHAGEGAAARGEGQEHEEDGDDGDGVDDADRGDEEEPHDEDGGGEEGASCVREPSQVEQAHHDQDREAQPERERCEAWEGRHEGGDASRDGHSNVEGVVHNESTSRQQKEAPPEVLPGNHVAPAALAVAVDDVPVRDDEDDE